MGELRKHPFLNRWVLFAPKRGARPHEFGPPSPKKDQTCPFCPGNEHMACEEIGHIPDESGGWAVRWFENMFGAVHLSDDPASSFQKPFWHSQGSFGHHEVIVETPDHSKQLWDLSIQEVSWVIDVYKRRIERLSKLPHISYVQVFKNSGYLGGTSLRHSHSQVVALPIIPPAIDEEIKAVEQSTECPYCKLLAIEENGPRHVFSNAQFVAITPYASAFSYELEILPRKHIASFDSRTSSILLAEAILYAIRKLKTIDAAYDIVLHYAPLGRNSHTHVKILPRLSIWAGFELGTDIPINSVLPEDAAKFYKGDDDANGV